MVYDKVKALCDKQKLPIYELEKTLNMGNGSIAVWKKGSPRLETIAKVAKFFDVPIEYFLTDELDKTEQAAE